MITWQGHADNLIPPQGTVDYRRRVDQAMGGTERVDVRQVFVDAGDIAAVVAAALTTRGHTGRSHEVTGPRPLSFGEALGIVGRAAGREIRFLGSVEEFLAAQAGLGVPRAEAAGAAEAFSALRGLGDGEPTDVVRHVTGRPPKDFEAYAAEAARHGAWRA